MSYDVQKALIVPLSAYEREIDEAAAINSRNDFADNLKMSAIKTMSAIRGGARPGSGRKPRAHIRTTVLLAPQLREKLDAMATREGSLSAAVEKMIQASL